MPDKVLFDSSVVWFFGGGTTDLPSFYSDPISVPTVGLFLWTGYLMIYSFLFYFT